MKEKEGEKLLLRVQKDSRTDIDAVARNNGRDTGKVVPLVWGFSDVLFPPLPCSLWQSVSPRH